MAWNRPDRGTWIEDPWSAAPGAPGTRWGPLKPGPVGQSAFVFKLQEYGSLSVQRFLDIGWVKIAHSVTKDIFPERGRRAALHTVHSPTPLINYGQAKDYVLYRYGRLPEGRGQEAFSSTLADYIFTEVSARAETCRADVHYKVIDNRLWYLMGRYVEPVPSSQPNPCPPPDTDDGRNLAGNVYEALVGLYWLEDNFQGLTDISLTPMDLTKSNTSNGQPLPGGAPQGSSGVPPPSGARGVRVRLRQAWLWLPQWPSPSAGAVAEPRLPCTQDPGNDLFIPEWQEGYVGDMPQGGALPPPPPPPTEAPRSRGKAGNHHQVLMPLPPWWGTCGTSRSPPGCA